MSFKILLVANINSTHIQKWAISLAEKGVQVGIFSLSPLELDWVSNKENIQILYTLSKKNKYPLFAKILSLSALEELKYVIEEFKPDILHAHYASSYGVLGALSGFHPFVLSVWGSDVFNFPNISFLHKWILKFNLRRADKICSTSNIMKEEIQKYTDKDISVIPFGVDLNTFKPFYAHHVFQDDAIVIGTVKQLEKEYGLEYLIDAFALLRKKIKGYSIKLLIVGQGSIESELKTRVKDIGIDADTVFTGYIPPEEIPFYQNMFSITVFPSLNESFGVSVIEAMACEKPVVVSDVGGLPEVIENGVTGLVVPAANAEKLAEAIGKLIMDEELRTKLGKQGRIRVQKLYNLQDNLTAMYNIYTQAIAGKAK